MKKAVVRLLVIAALILGVIFAGCIEDGDTPSPVPSEREDTTTPPQSGEHLC